jgi:hypothetical protein
MKKIFSILIIAVFLFTSCKKNTEQNVFASMVLINASPTPTTFPAVEIFVDTISSRYSVGTIAYLANSTYLGVAPGSRRIAVKTIPTGTPASSTVVENSSDVFNGGEVYSYFMYDTLVAGKLKSFRVKDDLTVPTGLTTKVRFFHLAPNQGAIDVTLVRTSVTPNDSVTISNRSYVGASPAQSQLDTWATFQTIPANGGNTNYTIKIKQAGTQNVLLSANTTFNANRITTLFASGTTTGRPLTLAVHRNF